MTRRGGQEISNKGAKGFLGFLCQCMVVKREDHLLVGQEKDGHESDPFGYILPDGTPLPLAPAWLGSACWKGIFQSNLHTPDKICLPSKSFFF